MGTSPETALVNVVAAGWPTPLAPGEPYSFDAAFDSLLDLPPGSSQLPGSVRITRFDDAHPGGVPVTDATPLPANTQHWFGAYQVNGTAPLTGALSFRVEYSGVDHYAAADRTFDAPLAKYAPTLTLTAPPTAPRARQLTVLGRLTWPHAHVTTGTVTLRRNDPAHPSGQVLGTLPVAADGTVAFHDTPQTGGVNTYTLTYDGGSSYTPVTQSAHVSVSRGTPALSVTTDAASYHTGATARITAHLGPPSTTA